MAGRSDRNWFGTLFNGIISAGQSLTFLGAGAFFARLAVTVTNILDLSNNSGGFSLRGASGLTLIGSGNTQISISAGQIVFNAPIGLNITTVAALPAGSEGRVAYASDGRKVGEGVGTGTGVPVYFSNGSWRVFSTDAAVAA